MRGKVKRQGLNRERMDESHVNKLVYYHIKLDTIFNLFLALGLWRQSPLSLDLFLSLSTPKNGAEKSKNGTWASLFPVPILDFRLVSGAVAPCLILLSSRYSIK
jgi:hypothetical protein